MAVADAGGLETLTMRTLGQELGVGPMAFYRHVANKDDMVDGIVDLVFSEVDLPAMGDDWKTAMRDRAISLRDVLARHRWAIGLMESRRNPGPANLRHHDAVIGSLRAGGFDMAMAAHAYSVLDGYIYGFALTKMSLPFEDTSDIAEVAETMLARSRSTRTPTSPHSSPSTPCSPGYDYADEFEYGLDLILDGLEAPARRPDGSELCARPRPRAFRVELSDSAGSGHERGQHGDEDRARHERKGDEDHRAPGTHRSILRWLIVGSGPSRAGGQDQEGAERDGGQRPDPCQRERTIAPGEQHQADRGEEHAEHERHGIGRVARHHQWFTALQQFST